MSGDRFDAIVVGGGFAGSSLAIALSRRGLRVLLLEAETRFRDRVRGEILLPWGVTEARKLGIYDLLVAAGAQALPYRDTYVGGERRKRKQFADESDNHEAPLAFPHAAVQEKLIAAAAAAGAEVRRGAKVTQALGGSRPSVAYEADGEVSYATADLLVGADGRSSRVRSLAGFETSSGSGGLMTAGVALWGVGVDDDALAASFNRKEMESASLLPQGGGRARAYLTYRAEKGPVRDLTALKERMVAAGLPAQALEAVTAAGPLASFNGTPKWVETPYRDGIALIGDAASVSDPAWGQGMALALRDANVLVEALSSSGDVPEAGSRYASEHARYSAVNRVVSRLMTQADYGVDAEAERLRVSDFWRRASRLIKAAPLSGPDLDLSEILVPGLPQDGLCAAAEQQAGVPSQMVC